MTDHAILLSYDFCVAVCMYVAIQDIVILFASSIMHAHVAVATLPVFPCQPAVFKAVFFSSWIS